MKTMPFRILDQATMNRIFELADEAGISREALRVPLAGEGEGRIERTAAGIWEIVLPGQGDLEPFFERLATALRAEGAT